MGDHAAPDVADEAPAAVELEGDDHPDVLAWAEDKGIRIGSDGRIDAGHLQAYHDEKAYRAEVGPIKV